MKDSVPSNANVASTKPQYASATVRSTRATVTHIRHFVSLLLLRSNLWLASRFQRASSAVRRLSPTDLMHPRHEVTQLPRSQVGRVPQPSFHSRPAIERHG